MNRASTALMTALLLAGAPATAASPEPPVPGVMSATEQPAVAVPGVASAASASERRLTPQQVDQVLADAARRNHEIPVGVASIADEQPCPQKPHGEMGVEAGTGGYGAMYGTAVVPLGCNAAAAISFETSQSNEHYRRRR